MRGDLREALHDLADALLPPQAEPRALFDAVRHVSALVRLSELDEGRRAMLELLLKQARTGVAQGSLLIVRALANHLTFAADRL